MLYEVITDYYIAKGERISPTVKQYITLLFTQKHHPEQLYNQCEGLLSLARKNDIELLDKACKKSMEAEYYSHNFINRITSYNVCYTKLLRAGWTEDWRALPWPRGHSVRLDPPYRLTHSLQL